MSESVQSTATIIEMNQSQSSSKAPASIITSSMQQPVDTLHKLMHSNKRTTSRPTSLSNPYMTPTVLPNDNELFKPVQLDSNISEDDGRSSSPRLSTIIRRQLINPPPQSNNVFRRTISRLSNLSFSAIPETASTNDDPIFRNIAVEHSMSRRQIAEIQLSELLNDPIESISPSARGAAAMTLEEVSKKLNTQPFIVERLLHVIVSLTDGSDVSTISQNNVIRLTRALNSTLSVRALVFFMMLDQDGDNQVSKNELSHFLERYLKNMSFDSNRLQKADEILLQSFHLDTKTHIDFEEFYSIIIKDPTILGSFSRFTVDPTWFRRVPSSQCRSNIVQRFCGKLCLPKTIYNKHQSKLTPEYLNNNLSRIALFILYILLNHALLLYVVIYKSVVTKSNVFEVFARTGGMLLNLNCSLVLVLMLKQTVLFIRSMRLLRKLIPVDSHIDFHKFVGRFIAVLAIVHTIAHMINYGRLQEYSWATYMFTTVPRIGWVHGFAPLSGLILCVILAMIVICSVERIRRKGYFQVFYWTHNLYIVFFALLIIHAENFWKWAIGPLVWFFLEKLYSYYTRYSSRKGRTYLNSVTIEQSNVISLNIHRPKNFNFKPGDYITISLPRVALYEFHPFTISSAPEETDILRVHIEASGNWTKRVYQRFKDISENSSIHDEHIKVYRADINPARVADEMRQDQNVIENENERNPSDINNATAKTRKKEKVFVNGPYSSCARYIFDCKHVVLIGGGIGVTPYASILSSLMAQFRASRITCQHCQHVNYDRKVLNENRQLKKIDFIWVSRDHKSFEWFFQLLYRFEQEQEAYLALNPNEDRFLTIHLYFTKIKNDEYVGHHPFELVTQLWAQVAGDDIFTGLKARTHIGRPIWENIFTEINPIENSSNANDVNVFFCGPPAMGKDIQQCCTKHHFHYYEENF